MTCRTTSTSEKTGVLHEQGVLERELPELNDVGVPLHACLREHP